MDSVGVVRELAKDEEVPIRKKKVLGEAQVTTTEVTHDPIVVKASSSNTGEENMKANTDSEDKISPENVTCMAVVDSDSASELDDEEIMMPENENENLMNVADASSGGVSPAKSKRRAKRKVVSQRPSTAPTAPTTALTIECWALPGSETQLARMDRVMGAFLDSLRAAGVTLPDNIQRMKQCSDTQHSNCYIYSFGMRRLHLATREIEGGRILLVVRCGGGFSDFADFAMRHGSIEQLKLQRQRTIGSRNVVQVSSVLSNGAVRLNEFPFV
jgi:hypothetical protein